MMEAGMGDVVNLKRFRKRTEREQSSKQADANRTRFGRTKSERVLEKRRTKRASDLLDQHRIGSEDAS
jgi:YD repeat-containing protein